MNSIKNYITITFLCFFGASHAVNVNPNGLGEVLIYPYYTVNNNHNTIYSIANTTADTKVLKITFREGQNGAEVLSFNVYLSAYDVWTGGLGPTTSTIAAHTGEPSVIHVSGDTSCTPFLNISGQEFLPYVIDLDFNNNNMLRAREGYLVVTEMSTFSGPTISWSDHGITGIPAACENIEGDWSDNDFYDTGDETPPSGGLSGSATILNVAEGTTAGYDAIALEHFWQGGGVHTSPGSLIPSLAHAFPQSVRLINGEAFISDWLSGIEAVTASLMQSQLNNRYEFDLILSGQSEWVVSFPTKFYHVNSPQPIAPFSQNWDGFNACEDVSVELWDREIFNQPTTNLNACYSSNVYEFLPSGTVPGSSSGLLGSNNAEAVFGIDDFQATEGGWATMNLGSGGQQMVSLNNIRYRGLPAVGFHLRRFINFNAEPGILASYAGLFPHQTVADVQQLTDLIFADGFEGP